MRLDLSRVLAVYSGRGTMLPAAVRRGLLRHCWSSWSPALGGRLPSKLDRSAPVSTGFSFSVFQLLGRRNFSSKLSDLDSNSGIYCYDFENMFHGCIVDDSDQDFQTLWSKIQSTHGEVPARDIVKEWKEEGNLLPKDLATRLLLKMCSRLWTVESLKFADWMDRQNLYELTDADELLRLEILCRCGHWPEAERKFKKLGKTEEAYLILLLNYTAKCMSNKVEQVVKEMKEAGFMSARAYAALFRMYIRRSDFTKALETLEEFEASGEGPDAGILFNLVWNKSSFKTIDAEAKALEAIGQLKLESTNRREMLRLHAALNKPELVQEVWDQIKGTPPVKASEYTAAMKSFEYIGDVDKVEELSQELEQVAGGISHEHACSMLRFYARTGMMDKAEEMYNKVMDMSRKPDGAPGFHMVIGYAKLKQLDKAVDWFKKTIDRGEDAHKPQGLLTEAMENLNQGFADKGDIKAAEQMMASAPQVSATRVYNSLMKVYLKAKVPAHGMEARLDQAKVKRNWNTNLLLGQLEELVAAA